MAYAVDGQCHKAPTMTEILPQKCPQILVILTNAQPIYKEQVKFKNEISSSL